MDELMRELAAYEGGQGLTPSDLLGLPDGLRHLATWLTRRGGASLGELATQLDCDEAAAAGLADEMLTRGLLLRDAALVYHTRMVGRKARASSDRLRDLF